MPVAVTLLMLVTPRDIPIAHYSIRSLLRLTLALPSLQAVVYCNGLSAEMIHKARQLLANQTRVTLIDNTARLKAERPKAGPFINEYGILATRQGPFEIPPDVWSRELISLPTEIVGIIDADFEALNHGFVEKMLCEIGTNPNIAFYSTDYNPTQELFETYSKERALIWERWHTWFCLYRRSALLKAHNFGYFEDRGGKIPIKFDHSSKLQQILIQEHGYMGASLNGEMSNQYIHYGAFAQNRSLCGRRLSIYRLLKIASHNGWKHKHGSALASKLVRRAGKQAYRALRMGRYDSERATYAHEAL